MSLSNSIAKMRLLLKISQEDLAEKIGVSRQAVQKWETGSANPDIENLMKIAKYFNVSLDELLLERDMRIADGLFPFKTITPSYGNVHYWESYADDLLSEYRQSYEEGKDIGKYESLFKATANLPASLHKEKIANVIFDMILNAPQRIDYKYNEPSDLEGIKRLSSGYKHKKSEKISNLENKIHGAWLGRICGCLLGKPIEGIRTNELIPLLKETNNYPLYRYIRSSEITDEIVNKYKFVLKGKCFDGTFSSMPADDDINYTVMAYLLIKNYGRDFVPGDLANLWLSSQTIYSYFTAERVAFKNLVAGYQPPNSALYKNPYREWIGAQIRGDFFGYINPGDPITASEMAFKDASISHIKNGIYGEMFIAACIAQAAVSQDISEIIEVGLSTIPTTSRLYEEITELHQNYKAGMKSDECFEKIHKKYDEHNPFDWCHVIPNALICVGSLLYGNSDFGKTICLAVQTGFDTDCNGATVGSIIGIMKGIEGIDKKWYASLNDTLQTTLRNISSASISQIAKETFKFIK